ncbi:MAG: dTDP-4-dehydrorhamnose reductase [Burkholderiaceae bacterium]
MKVLVTGAKGQVGWELCRSLLLNGDVVALDRSQADLSRPQSLVPIIREIRPDIIVNAAAYTAVDRAETEEELATRVNGESVGVLAEECKRLGALLIHYSTDYVFDGLKDAPYSEDDVENPQNAYGRSKLAGEKAIRAIAPEHLILRTSWVFAERGNNFVKTIVRLAKERTELRIVGDQFGAPTWAASIADATSHILKHATDERLSGQFQSGTFHLASQGYTNWHAFASCIVALYRKHAGEDALKVQEIRSIRSSEYPVAARRPSNSRLKCERIQSRFGIHLPDWEACVAACIRELN